MVLLCDSVCMCVSVISHRHLCQILWSFTVSVVSEASGLALFVSCMSPSHSRASLSLVRGSLFLSSLYFSLSLSSFLSSISQSRRASLASSRLRPIRLHLYYIETNFETWNYSECFSPGTTEHQYYILVNFSNCTLIPECSLRYTEAELQ